MGDTQDKPASPATPEGNASDDAAQPQGSSENGEKFVPLEKHKAKLGKAFADRDAAIKERDELIAQRDEQERSKMSELELLKADNEKLKKQVNELSFTQKKQDALAKAKRDLGSDKEITPENEERISKLLGKLNTTEDTLDEDVADLVSGWATNKASQQPSGMVVGKAARIDKDKDPLDYTPKELDKIQREDPDKYEKIRAARKNPNRKKDGDGKG